LADEEITNEELAKESSGDQSKSPAIDQSELDAALADSGLGDDSEPEETEGTEAADEAKETGDISLDEADLEAQAADVLAAAGIESEVDSGEEEMEDISEEDMSVLTDFEGMTDTTLSAEPDTSIQEAIFPALKSKEEQYEQGNIERLMDVSLNVSVELGRKIMMIKDILALGPGHIVELDKLAGEPVDLLVNGKKMAKGEVVVIDENFGVRITDLLSREERLKQL